MKGRMIYLIISIIVITGAVRTASPAAITGRNSQRARVIRNYGQLPLAFEANQGQVDSRVKFFARGAGYGVFLTRDEALLTLRKTADPTVATRNTMPQAERSAVLRMKLVGSNSEARVSGQEELSGKSNYFIGNDPKKWQVGIRQYGKVRYTSVYPGIDLLYYGHQGKLEYDFVLQPGADPHVIRLSIQGARIVQAGEDLVLSSPCGEVHLRAPHVYQEGKGRKIEVPSSYVTRDNDEVGFQVGPYDKKRSLIIDPVLVYSTYLGGSSDEIPIAITVDAAGNAYVIGGTTSADFPTANPLQPNFNGGMGDHFGEGDAFVSKLSPDGSSLIYSTYLGGSRDELGQGIAVDASGIYLTGFTGSSDFPTVNAVQSTHRGWRNAFVSKLNPAGDALIYSTFLGGGEDYGWGIAVDSSGRAHVRGDTRSPYFPVVNAIQPTLRSHYLFNCFVAEFSVDGTHLLYSTYWGGSGGEGGVGIGVDSAGNTYVGGYTLSGDFPTVNPIQATLAGGMDAFVTKFSADGQTAIYSTFLGGSGDEWAEGFTVDSLGNAYIVGNTSSSDFPTVHAVQPAYAGGVDAYVAKVNSAGNALIYSTYLGGSLQDHATGIAVDSGGNAYVSGHTTSTNFPTVDPIQGTNHGARDAFLTKLSADGSMLIYSTYLGGSAVEGGERDVNVAVDTAGNAYMTGITWSDDFPVTAGAFQATRKGNADAFVAKIASTVPDVTPPAITVTANPHKLWPPDASMVPVTISGTITDSGSGVKPGSPEYAVQDEYHLIQPQGKVIVDSLGNYSFTVKLRASRESSDLNGRTYTIRVNARDNAGNRGAKFTRVLVPYTN